MRYALLLSVNQKQTMHTGTLEDYVTYFKCVQNIRELIKFDLMFSLQIYV